MGWVFQYDRFLLGFRFIFRDFRWLLFLGFKSLEPENPHVSHRELPDQRGGPGRFGEISVASGMVEGFHEWEEWVGLMMFFLQTCLMIFCINVSEYQDLL